jgi:glycosyltransferase involved in cell wall biosynthesis
MQSAIVHQEITSLEAERAAARVGALRILYLTSQWPTPEQPSNAPFVRREVRWLREAGLVVDVLVYDGGWSPHRYLRAVQTMRQMLRQRHYDVIHVRFGQCGLVGRAQWQAPVVIMYGGSDVEGTPNFRGVSGYKNLVLRMVSRVLSLLVDEVIVVSENLGRQLPRRDYHLIPSGLNLDLFKPMDKAEARARLGLPAERKLALFAGNPANRRKRYDLAVEVCERAGHAVDVELVVLTGKEDTEVPLYMSACDVLLLTSTNEGSPNVVKEALACNLSVVSTDVGDVRERIGGLESCAVCKNDDPDIIAAELVRVLRRPGRPNLRPLVENLASQAMIQKIIAVYERALVRRGRK